MALVYVSSTKSDLEAERNGVMHALRRVGHDVVAMEEYVAEATRPLARCLEDVRRCNLYVGIFAFHYGSVPDEGNPGKLSITELEYRQAIEADMPCLLFLLSEDAAWPRSKQDKGDALDHIEALRAAIMARHVVDMFETTEELMRKVNEAVVKWQSNSGTAVPKVGVDWDAYRASVFDRHQWVRMQVIAGAAKDKGPVRIPLLEVFEPQMAAPGMSSTDVPDEVRRYQRQIYGSRADGATVGGNEPLETVEPDADDELDADVRDEPLREAAPEVVLKVLGRERTQVILGGPGSGKSTIIQHALLRFCKPDTGADEPSPLPFLIELRDFVIQKQSDFVAYIAARAKSYYASSIDVPDVDTALRHGGRALVFFDGLDEIFDPDERRHVIDRFQAFARTYPNARIVVTSRIAGYDQTALGLDGFQHYTLLPLNLTQIGNFAQHWYRRFSLEGTERTADGLVRRIVESPRLHDLAGNPLLLTMMSVIYRDRDLPTERWRLYSRCADTLLEDWDLNKGFRDEAFRLAVPIRNAQKAEILERVSMYMLEHGQSGRELNAVAYAPLVTIVSGYLEEKYVLSLGQAEAGAVDILHHLMERTYVLAGIGERVYGFVHRTFMEYFAAGRCKSLFNASKSDFTWLNRDVFGKHWDSPEWEEVLLLLCAMLHDQGTPIREVIEYLLLRRKSGVPFNVAFAARCLGEAGDVQDLKQAQALLVRLTHTIAEHAPGYRRDKNRAFLEAALKGFASLSPWVPIPPAVHETLDKLERDGSVAARMAAWQMGFAMRSRKERLPYALAALREKNRDDTVRLAAIASLEREWPGRADIAPTLVDLLRSERKAAVCTAVLGALQRSWRSMPSVLDALAERGQTLRDERSMVACIKYLATSWRGNSRARDLILEMARNAPAGRGGAGGSKVLASAASGLATNWPGDAVALEFLCDRVVHEVEPASRMAALHALGEGWAGDSGALAFLLELATNHPDPQRRGQALDPIATGWADDPGGREFLRNRATNEPDSAARLAAIRIVAGDNGVDPSGSQFLAAMYDRDPTVSVRSSIVRAFIERARMQRFHFFRYSGDVDPAIDFLRERALHDPDPAIRADVIASLGSLDPFRRSHLRDDDAEHVFDDGSSGVIDQILWAAAVDDTEPINRVLAISSLAGTPTRMLEAATWLRPLLEEQAIAGRSPARREHALWAVADTCSRLPWALPFLMNRACNDPEVRTRAAALRAIGWCCEESSAALDFLIDRAQGDPENRSVAEEVVKDARGRTYRRHGVEPD